MSPSWLPCLIRRVAPNPRIQRSEFVNSYQQQPVCCLVFFFFILSPSQELMHCTLSIATDFFCGVMTPTLLPVRPGLIDGCWTFLSVSLSLSLCHSVFVPPFPSLLCVLAWLPQPTHGGGYKLKFGFCLWAVLTAAGLVPLTVVGLTRGLWWCW